MITRRARAWYMVDRREARLLPNLNVLHYIGYFAVMSQPKRSKVDAKVALGVGMYAQMAG